MEKGTTKLSNSSLVDYTKISPNSTNPRNNTIKKITPHHMAGNLTVESSGSVFASSSRQAPANYGIGTDGRVGMYVEEKNRAWTSNSAANDNQAVTIEVANDEMGGNWHVSDKALAKLIDLCVDICQRNGIAALVYTGDSTGNLTLHNMFAATACPGPYLQSKMSYVAQEVNKRLSTAATEETTTADTLYRVQVGAYSLESNADAMAAKLKADGFDTYITTNSGTSVSAKASASIAVGDKVKVNSGAKTYTGGSLASFVYTTTYDVIQIDGDRVVIGIGTSVTAAMNIADLTKA